MSGSIGTNSGRASGSIGTAASGPTVSSSDPAIDTNAELGTQWANSTSGEFYVLTDATTDENIWTNVDAAGDDITPPASMRGSRGFSACGHSKDSIDYWAIATLGNATDFGNAVEHTDGKKGVTNITRAVMWNNGTTNVIEYITCGTAGNALDFGDETTGTDQGNGPECVGNGTRGIAMGRSESDIVDIDYITIASAGNATDFGDRTQAGGRGGRGENETRGVCMGGAGTNVIDYITMATTGNATDFGDRTTSNYNGGGVGGGGRAMSIGGHAALTTMEFVTIATTGNATDFGDLTVGARGCDACSNDTRGVRAGGVTEQVTLDYWAMVTAANAVDFGDLNEGKQYTGCFSGVPL